MKRLKCYLFGHPDEGPITEIPMPCCCDDIDRQLPALRILVWLCCLPIVFAALVPITLKDMALMAWRNRK
jgi:hypothetical protein